MIFRRPWCHFRLSIPQAVLCRQASETARFVHFMTRARTLPIRALSGLKIKVIDQNADYDAKGAIESQLEALGAQSGSSLKSCPYKALTHIVIVQRNKRDQNSLRSTIDWLSRVRAFAILRHSYGCSPCRIQHVLQYCYNVFRWLPLQRLLISSGSSRVSKRRHWYRCD